MVSENGTQPESDVSGPGTIRERTAFSLLTREDGTLCAFCDAACKAANPTGEPFLTRKLLDLIRDSKYCGVCAVILDALESSAHAIGEEGQEVAMHLHPLLQTVQDPSDVRLRYIDLHDWFEHGIQTRVYYPGNEAAWATLDLVPAKESWQLNLLQLSPSAQSDEVWKGIKWWLSSCIKEHPDCKIPRILTQWRPTRILDLGKPDDPMQIRLLEGDDVPEGLEYVTLSHCWGNSNPLQLTTSNISCLKKSIHAESLPRTFLEACNIVRRLEQRYLWIDSLCILQDSREDWFREAGQMASVYGNAFLGVAATGSPNSEGGCFGPGEDRDPKAFLPVRIQRLWGGPFSGDFYVCGFRQWWSEFNNAPLNRRAWVLQERMLSPRVLHFGLGQMVFECASMTACERLPFGTLPQIIREFGGNGGLSKKITSWALGVGEAKVGRYEFQSEWGDVIRNYSQASLTFEMDKMVALAGIVDRFALALERIIQNEEVSTAASGSNQAEIETTDSPRERDGRDLFVAGLWKPGLERQLAWRVTSAIQSHQLSGRAPPGHGERPLAYVAPSWSWCSVFGAPVEPQSFHPDVNFIEILETKIEPVIEAPESLRAGLRYCCGRDSYLRLRCSMLPLSGISHPSGILIRTTAEGEDVMIETDNYFDVPFEKEAGTAQALACVPLYVDSSRVTKPLHGLILERLEEADGTFYFVRYGTFVVSGDATKTFWAGCRRFNEDFRQVHGDEGRLYDGVYQHIDDIQDKYEKQDGVMQYVIQIQ